MRRLLAAVAAVAAVALLAPAAGAQATGRISLAGQTPWVRPDGPFQVRIDVRAPRTEGLDVAVTVHRRIRSRSQFERTVEGELLGSRTTATAVAVDDLRFGPGGAVMTVELPRLAPGVYPVDIALRERGRRLDGFVTHLVRLPDDAPALPLSVAWVQPVRSRPSIRPGGERSLAPDDLARLRVVAAAVAAAGIPLTLDATPETLEALEAAGEADVLAALDRARQQSEVLAAPYVDLDVAALVAAGLGDRIAEQRTAGEQVLRRVLRTRGEARLWSIDDPVDERALARLRSIGVSGVVVDERHLEPLPPSVTGGITLTRPFALAAGSGGPLEAAAVDPGLVAHLADGDPVLASHRLLADLAVLYFDSPGIERGVVVRPPEGWEPDPELLGIVLPALGNPNRPILRPVTVDELFTTVDPLTEGGDVVERRPAGDVGRLGVRTDELLEAREAAAAFVRLAGSDHEVAPRLEELLLAAEADGLRPDERRRYLAEVLAEVDAVRNEVRVESGRTFRLTAREGTIPVTVVNDNDFPVTATLVLSSDKLEFRGADPDDRSRLVVRGIELAPGRNPLTFSVKVRASGRFPVQATLLDGEGRVELFRASYTVTSTVTSGIGIALSAGALLFLLLWWGSHWRTVRRDRRLVEVAQ